MGRRHCSAVSNTRWMIESVVGPRKIDREAIDDLFALRFMRTGHNAVLVGPNGIGKTMILKSLAHQGILRGRLEEAKELSAARSKRRGKEVPLRDQLTYRGGVPMAPPFLHHPQR